MAGIYQMSEELPEKMVELPERTRAFLAGLRPDELKTLEAIIEMPAEDVREGFRMVRDMRTVGKFMRWLLLSMIALFVGSIMLYENIQKAIGYLKGGPTP
jgi:hypothetical protein